MGNDFLRDEVAHSSMVKAPRPEVSVLLYPGCILFETALALALEQVAGHFSVKFYTPQGDPHYSSQGFQLQPHGSYEALALAKSAAVLVPGGDSRGAVSAEHSVKEALQAQLHRGALIAAICAGNLVLAYAGESLITALDSLSPRPRSRRRRSTSVFWIRLLVPVAALWLNWPRSGSWGRSAPAVLLGGIVINPLG